MNTVEPLLHQLKLALDSLIAVCDRLEEKDWERVPYPGARTVREQMAHLALIAEADMRIAGEAGQAEMAAFYADHPLTDPADIKAALEAGYTRLYETYSALAPEELAEVRTAYWGVSYSRYGWLVEIFGHIYHHRGQLYTQLAADGVNLKGIVWFE